MVFRGLVFVCLMARGNSVIAPSKYDPVFCAALVMYFSEGLRGTPQLGAWPNFPVGEGNAFEKSAVFGA